MGDMGNKKVPSVKKQGLDQGEDSLKGGASSRRGSELTAGGPDGKQSESAAGGKADELSAMQEEKQAKRRLMNMNMKTRDGPPPTGDEYRQWKVHQAKGADKRLAALEQRVERLAELENLLQELDAAEQAAMERGWATAQSAPTLPVGRQVELPGTVMTGDRMEMMSMGEPQPSLGMLFASRDVSPVGASAGMGMPSLLHESLDPQDGLVQEDDGEHPKPLPSLLRRMSKKPGDGTSAARPLSPGAIRRAVKEEIDQIFVSMGQRPTVSSAPYHATAHDQYGASTPHAMLRGENSNMNPTMFREESGSLHPTFSHSDTGYSGFDVDGATDGTQHVSAHSVARGNSDVGQKEHYAASVVHSKVASVRAATGPPDNIKTLNEADFKDGLSVPVPPEDGATVLPIDGSKAVQPGDKPIVQAGARTLMEAVPFSCSLLFGGFSRENTFRRLCFWIYRNPVFSAIFQLTNLANASLLTMYPEWFGTNVVTLDNPTMEANVSKDTLRIVKYFDLACVGVLFLEVIVGIIALGFFRHSSCWLRSSGYHKLDFAIVVIVIVEYVANYAGFRGVTLRPFRLLRVLKYIMRINSFRAVVTIGRTFKAGVAQVLVVVGMMSFFIATFAICGLNIYQKSFRRRCVISIPNASTCASDSETGWAATCNLTAFREDAMPMLQQASYGNYAGGITTLAVPGGFPFHKGCKVFENETVGEFDGVYPMDSMGRYHSCQLNEFRQWQQESKNFKSSTSPAVQQWCEELTNPFYGFVHFDHIGGAMVAIAMSAVPDAYYMVVHYMLETEPSSAVVAWVIVTLITCLCTFLLLGLFVAVVTGTFGNVKAIEEAKAAEDEEVAKAAGNAEGGENDKEKTLYQRLETAAKSFAHGNSGRTAMSKRATPQEMQIERDSEEDKIMTTQMQGLVASKWFFRAKSIVILMHIFGMATDSREYPDLQVLSIYIHIVCNVLFFGLTVLTVVANASLSTWFSNSANRFELFLVLSGFIGIAVGSEVLLILPALRVYMLMLTFPTTETLLISAVATIRAFADLLVFFFILMSVFAIISRYMFGQLLVDTTRSNYSTYPRAMLTLFQVFTGDSWTGVLYDSMVSKPDTFDQLLSALFVVSWLLISNLAMMNLFVATLIQNFDVAGTLNDIKKPGNIAALRDEIKRYWAIVHASLPKRKRKRPKRSQILQGSSEYDLSHAGAGLEPDEQFPLSHKLGMTGGSGAVDASGAGGKSHMSVLTSPSGKSLLKNSASHRSIKEDGDKVGSTKPLAEIHSKMRNEESAGSDMVTMAGNTASNEREAATAKSTKLSSVINNDPPANAFGDYEPYPTHVISYRNEVVKVVTDVPPVIDVNAEAQKVNQQRVLLFFSHTHPLRLIFIRIGKLAALDALVFGAIVVSCMFLVLFPPYEDYPASNLVCPWPQYVDPKNPTMCRPILYQTEVTIANSVFFYIFMFEFVTRVMSQGLFFTREGYLRSGWNVVDFLVLCLSLVEETGILPGGSIGRVVRMGRVLRPLRLMKRNNGMRIIIDALIGTLRPVLYVVAFVMITFFVFSLMGMGMFGRKMSKCNDGDFVVFPQGVSDCAGPYTMSNGVMVPRVWDKTFHNFDNIWDSMLTLLRVNTVKYVAIINDMMDITDVDTQPKTNYNEIYSLFMVIYLMIGNVLAMNLFIGFIIDGFNANRGATDADVQYSRFVRQIWKVAPREGVTVAPRNKYSTFVRNLTNSNYFQIFSGGCVAINTLFMIADHADAPQWFITTMEIQNLVFYAELWMEILLFFIAYGYKGPMYDWWKIFDIIVVGGITLGYALNNPKITQFVKSFRLMRVVRLMTIIKPIRIILDTLLICMPQLANILLLLILVYTMFSIVLMNLFATTKYGIRSGPTANFDDFGRAIATIYQIITGDEWDLIMLDYSVEAPFCTLQFGGKGAGDVYGWDEWGKYPNLSFGDCGSSLSARILFVVFKIVGESILLNLFIGMILDKFGFITDEVAQVETADWSNGSTARQIEELTEIFTRFGRSGYIACSTLERLLFQWPQPLGYVSEDGVAVRTAKDLASQKLIAAELQVIVLREQVRLEKEEQHQTRWQKVKKYILRATAEKPHFKRNISAMGFIDIITTVLYWRLPTMVPTSLKQERLALVDEVVKMAKALALTNSVNRLLARKKKAEVSRALQSLIDFRKWARSDEIMVRRNEMLEEIKRRKELLGQEPPSRRSLFIQTFARAKRALGHRSATAYSLELKEVPPWKSCMITMSRIEQPPNHTIEHKEAARELFPNMKPTPQQSIGAFIEFAGKYDVVLRFLDTGHANSIGLVICNFSKQCGNWVGWTLRERSNDADDANNDAMLQPETRRANSQVAGLKNDGRWLEIGMEIKPVREMWEQNKDLSMEPMGSLLDVHGFVVPEGLDKEGEPIDLHTEVRLSLGTMAFVQQRKREKAAAQLKKEHLKREKEEREKGNVQKSKDAEYDGPKIIVTNPMALPEDYDAVMKVVGYVRRPGDQRRDLEQLETRVSKIKERLEEKRVPVGIEVGGKKGRRGGARERAADDRWATL